MPFPKKFAKNYGIFGREYSNFMQIYANFLGRLRRARGVNKILPIFPTSVRVGGKPLKHTYEMVFLPDPTWILLLRWLLCHLFWLVFSVAVCSSSVCVSFSKKFAVIVDSCPTVVARILGTSGVLYVEANCVLRSDNQGRFRGFHTCWDSADKLPVEPRIFCN